ncbi:MAG: SigE family RNA polymerase sigma factor [Mycobacteriales bacterium]
MRDDEGFERFVLAAYPGLMRRAFLLVGDHGHAEDLVQGALTTAYLRWRKVREPHAYLRTVMTRSAIGMRTRRWRGEYPTDPLPDRPRPEDPQADVDLADAVRRALMALPPEQRAVVVLRYFEDCPEAEIAEILGCSAGTVKSRASRALAALRAGGLLAEEGHLR